VTRYLRSAEACPAALGSDAKGLGLIGVSWRAGAILVAVKGTLCTAALIPVVAAWPCIPVTRPGELVSIADENALIVWDPQSKTEWFVREATFSGPGKHFAFFRDTVMLV
jgi:hypothetical protein